jgi:hypothetical protein
MKLENQSVLKGVKTIVFYCISTLVVYLLNAVSPSGPCVPGLGAVSFILLIPTIIILLLINLFKILEGDRTNILSAVIHSLVLLTIVIVFKIYG